MVWFAIALAVLGLAVFGLVFFDPEHLGAPLVEGLPRVPRGTPLKTEPVAQAGFLEVVSAPSGRYPLVQVSLGSFGRNFGEPKWARVKVLDAAGQGPLLVGAEVGLGHGKLEAGQRFVACLNARGEVVDGYPADADGKVRLISDDSASAKAVPYDATEPMTPAEALLELVGKPPSTTPTKFRP